MIQQSVHMWKSYGMFSELSVNLPLTVYCYAIGIQNLPLDESRSYPITLQVNPWDHGLVSEYSGSKIYVGLI